MTLWAQILWSFRGSMGPIKWPMDQTSPTWLGTIERVQDHQEPDLPKVEGEFLGGRLEPKRDLELHLEDFEGDLIKLWPHSLDEILRLEVHYSDAFNFSACIIFSHEFQTD
ncbi:hypothetical protein O181_043200 [Austropuccinia psidii MF-1]|uniref:Uncharacterized protein n=1 Tax=Austropuccinia psidii MF-1 TaxID=1389203 RepID=A0A9Q3HIX3_9BASI|nr:hypothetical protein [Austropuccinia psidii MF-1]